MGVSLLVIHLLMDFPPYKVTKVIKVRKPNRPSSSLWLIDSDTMTIFKQTNTFRWTCQILLIYTVNSPKKPTVNKNVDQSRSSKCTWSSQSESRIKRRKSVSNTLAHLIITLDLTNIKWGSMVSADLARWALYPKIEAFRLSHSFFRLCPWADLWCKQIFKDFPSVKSTKSEDLRPKLF